MSGSNDPAAPPPRAGPTREAISTVIITIGLLAALVWYIRPPRADFKPAPIEVLPNDCPKINRPFVPSNITEIPGLPLTELGSDKRLRALYRINFEPCPCGCNQSIAECLANHPQCKVCRDLAARVFEEVKSSPPKKP